MPATPATQHHSSPTPTPDLATLAPSWELALKVEGKRPRTIENYTTGLRLFLRWCAATGHPPAVDRGLVTQFVANAMDGGVSAGTAAMRLQALKRFSVWLVAEGELDDDPLATLKQPPRDVVVTEPLTDDELRALCKACAGRSFRDRRDEAAVRLLAETGMRCGELLALATDDVDVARGVAIVRHAKNHRGRVVPFGAATAQALDRYVRLRRHHALAGTSRFWLGDGSRYLAYHGLRASLLRRAEVAGIKNFHLHLLRHTAATRWLRAGGSEGGLMAVAGWQRREMIDRYVAATASERAADEARGLGLGDF